MESLTQLWRTSRGCCLISVLIALLLIFGSCLALGWGLARLSEAAAEPGLDVILVIDQSGSLWELGGVGSDPDQLRMEGARLVATYLGVDDAAQDYRLGVVYFGSQPQLVAPLTPLVGQGSGRQQVLAALSQEPEPLGWTDIDAALAVAYQELFEGQRALPGRATAVVVFTDGRPQTEAISSPAADDAYLDQLRAWVSRFSERGTAFYTVLLGNAVTAADPQTREVYRPLWVDLAESGLGVHFYDAWAAEDLMAIYHDIAVHLQRRQSAGAVVDQAVSGQLEAPIDVPGGWQRVSFVVHKSDPALAVRIVQPNGAALRADDPGVTAQQSTQGASDARYDVWSVEWPTPGQWRLQVDGPGTVTAWLDYVAAPATPTASATATASPTPSATATATPTATATATPTASATPSPSPSPTATPTSLTVNPASLAVAAPQPGGRYPAGAPIPVLVQPAGDDPALVEAFVAGPDVDGALAITATLPLTISQENAAGQILPLETPGAYTLTVRQVVELGRGVRLQDEVVVPFSVERTAGLPWGWMALGGLLLASAGGGLAWLRSQQPTVEGALRLISGPGSQLTGQVWDLEALRRRSLSLGWAKRCDVVLARDPTLPAKAARIVAQRSDDGRIAPVLIDLCSSSQQGLGSPSAVRVQGQPIGRRYPLHDQDVLQIGAYQLRYENLALRRQAQAWQPASSRLLEPVALAADDELPSP